jgi:hypothetical protein
VIFSLKKLDFHANKMNGKERMVSMLLGSHDVDCLACQWMPQRLLMTLRSVGMT